MDLTPAVFEALTLACSQDVSVLKPAEEQLKQQEVTPGFYSAILSVCCNHQVDLNVRWLAALYFKNGIDKYWRRNAPNAISEDEKVRLRGQLLQSFNEPVPQIATQLAVLIGKIARLDCPNSWQELIPTLLENVRSNDQLTQHRTLLTTYYVVKALSSKRLAHDRRVFQELCNNIYFFILELWTTHFRLFVDLLYQSSKDPSLVAHLDQSYLAVKVLRKLSIYGITNFTDSQQGNALVALVFERMEVLLSAKPHMDVSLLAKREKYITLMTKVLLDIQEYHPAGYIPFIRQSLELTVRFNFTEQGTGLLYERFSVNLFNLMRAILRCEMYRPDPTFDVADISDPVKHEAYSIKMSFFTENTLQEITRRLLLNYFQLTNEDLELWDTDPEEYVVDTSGDSWKYTLRPCTENLYLTLIKEFRLTVTPFVVDLVKEFHQVTDPNDLSALLKKEAVYTAVGLASFDLFDDINFHDWYTNELQLELKVTHQNYRIIRRRVIWLVGCWVQALKCNVYDALLPSLMPAEDLVVRLETANTVKSIVDDFEFSKEEFMPYLEKYFSLLFQLLKDVTECETKMQVLHVMSFIVERMEHNIRPYAQLLVQHLPELWRASEEHNMLRCAIITILINLVQSFGVLSTSMHPLLFDIIRMSNDLNNESHAYLIEDGLDLWITTVRCSPHCSDGMLQLLANLPQLLEFSTELFPTYLQMIDAYLVLDANRFYQMCGSSLISTLQSCAADMRSAGLVYILELLDVLLQVVSAQVYPTLLPILQWFAQNFFDSEIVTQTCVATITLYARVIVLSHELYFSVMDSLAQSTGKQAQDVLSAYLDRWLEFTDCIVDSSKRKLSAMALLVLLTTQNMVVLDRFPLIMNFAVEALHDVCHEDGSVFTDSLVITSISEDQGHTNKTEDLDNYECEHERRKFKISQMDPVCSVNLRDYALSQMNTCQQVYGNDIFEKLIASIDTDVCIQLKHYLK